MNLADIHKEAVNWRRLVELNSARIRNEMQAAGVEGVLTCTYDNWRYLTSLPGLVSMAYFTCNLALIVTDLEFPYIFPLDDLACQIEDIAPWFDNIRPLPFGGTREPQQPLEAGTWIDIISQSLRELKLIDKRLALDPAFPYRWHEELSRRLPQVQITSACDILRRARLIKNEEEQKAIRKACLIGEIGVEAGLNAVEAGKTEAEIAAVVEYNFRAHGGEYPHSTPFVIAGDSGKTGLIGATHKVIQHSDLVRIDCGCAFAGYLSDYSRTVFVGEPDRHIREAYEACRQALMAGARAAKPGAKNTDLYHAIDSTLRKESKDRYKLGWFAGHGLGVGLHEDPMIGRADMVEEFEMQAGMYFCMEPAIIVEGSGMIGLEDDYLITEDGVEILTHTDFKL